MAWQLPDPHSARSYRRVLAFVSGASLAFYYGIFGGSYDPDPRGFAAVVVWSVIAVGLAAGILPRTRLPSGWQAAAALFAGLAVWTALSLVWSDSSEKTYIEITRALHYGGLIALAWLALDRHTWSAAAAGVFLGALVITCLALASRLIPDAFPTPDFELAGGTGRRLEYPFGYWNALGAWASMTAAMGLAWGSHARLPVIRVAAASAIPIAGVVVYLTYSRGSVIALGVGLAVAVLAAKHRWSSLLIAVAGLAGAGLGVLAVRDQHEIAEALGSAGAGEVSVAVAGGIAITGLAVLTVLALRIDRWQVGVELARSSAAVALAAVFMAIGGALISGFAGDVWDRAGSDPQAASRGPGADPAQRDTSRRLAGLQSSRTDIYGSALDAWSSEPILGIGAGNFEFWWAQNATTAEFIIDAHSIYIESLAELGPLGLALILGCIFWLGWLVIAVRRTATSSRRAGAAAGALGALAVFAVQGGIDWFWEYTGVTALALGSAAVAACGRSGARPRPASGQRWRVALTVTAVAMVMIQLPPWLSVRAIRGSADAIGAGDVQLARDKADRAASVEPWAARTHVELARVHAATGNLSAAARELREAIEAEPANWRHRAQLAGIEQVRGDQAAAEAARREALRLYKLPETAVDFVSAEMAQLAS